MDGLLFFWLSWLLWIIVAFIMPKSDARTGIACWLLLLVITSCLYFEYSNVTFSGTLFVLLTGGLLWMIKSNRSFIHAFTSFLITIAYTTIKLWEINLPILYIIPPNIITPLLISILIKFLIKRTPDQLIICIVGMTTGDLLYNYILAGYGFSVTINGFKFLDEMLVTIVIILILHILLWMRMRIVSLINFQLTRWQNE